MFIHGYCYGGDEGKSGFNPAGTVPSKKEAQDAIKEKLAGKKVTFIESSNKFRAYADGQPTGYIYLKVEADLWIGLDDVAIGSKGEKALFVKGTLSEVKDATRKFIEKDTREYTNGGPEVDTVFFDRTGDNIKVRIALKGERTSVPAKVTLIRVA